MPLGNKKEGFSRSGFTSLFGDPNSSFIFVLLDFSIFQLPVKQKSKMAAPDVVKEIEEGYAKLQVGK